MIPREVMRGGLRAGRHPRSRFSDFVDLPLTPVEDAIRMQKKTWIPASAGMTPTSYTIPESWRWQRVLYPCCKGAGRSDSIEKQAYFAAQLPQRYALLSSKKSMQFISTPAPAFYRRHRLTVADYDRMGEAGIFGAGERVELIEGDIVDMAPIGSAHAGTVKYLIRAFNTAVGQQAIVAAQDPVVLGVHSEPQPDIALLRVRADFYRSSHPSPADILLIVEVTDTTPQYDLEVKVPLYALHGIPETWVVDLPSRVLRVFREPSSAGYRQVQAFERPETLAPSSLPDAPIDLTGLF